MIVVDNLRYCCWGSWFNSADVVDSQMFQCSLQCRFPKNIYVHDLAVKKEYVILDKGYDALFLL